MVLFTPAMCSGCCDYEAQRMVKKNHWDIASWNGICYRSHEALDIYHWLMEMYINASMCWYYPRVWLVGLIAISKAKHPSRFNMSFPQNYGSVLHLYAKTLLVQPSIIYLHAPKWINDVGFLHTTLLLDNICELFYLRNCVHSCKHFMFHSFRCCIPYFCVNL